jgi:hypothetical protein
MGDDERAESGEIGPSRHADYERCPWDDDMRAESSGATVSHSL